MCPKRHQNNDNDRDEFRRQLKDVTPLKQHQQEPWREKPTAKRLHHPQSEPNHTDTLFSDAIAADELDVSDQLSFSRAGVQHNVMRKLKRGQYLMEAELDLHHHTVVEARHALVHFLKSAQQRGLRYVRIVHGKGNRSSEREPILKKKVNYWLRQREEVLAFCSALPRDGGTRAIYLILRKGKESRR